ncbi:basic leucine zipper and W2 domain-containing protein 2-like [Centruroides sculpturatus]|uniref:basic leucine zipper and W2 domain-containing protein 2-like n=1 Tax=Centruroides sculpturatus TaxID=218467 RepID=UPI000C6EBA19|nr:basic leucine zipper and W2 domain-containing protein 2-like [Centruroides sculpturatus]XP_023220829.1 basic leucine zipper and W2 domain-containing protein 2-like [Centruroides sculpturatus]XP_023220830.1 basic leucine zipper and W2 domain-containing protein 2-like [Centruroides sculpturatus]
MSQKNEKPTLSGQRIKTRKRDEKEKYDPTGFRDAILQGLNEAGSDLETVYKFLDSAGSKLDYRRYGETLFDILLAGGILAPGGSLAAEADPSKVSRTDVCIFSAQDNLETLRSYAQVFTKLIRRYKYLEKTLEDEFKKVMVFLKGFTPEERRKLAKVTSILVAGGQIPASVLANTLQDHLVRDGIALEFIMDVFQAWLVDKDSTSLWGALRKAGLDTRLLEFFPVSKRSQENLIATFKLHGLTQLLEYQKAQENSFVKKELQQQVFTRLKEKASVKEIIPIVKEYMIKYSLPEPDVAVLLWTSLMAIVEWNKKEELVAEQALKHLRQYTSLLSAFTQNAKAELALLVKVQEFCYDNMNFMKVFQKIVVLLYKTDVLSEDVILKWYKAAHSSKGKSVFLDQMKRFVEWLQNAEEESEGED